MKLSSLPPSPDTNPNHIVTSPAQVKVTTVSYFQKLYSHVSRPPQAKPWIETLSVLSDAARVRQDPFPWPQPLTITDLRAILAKGNSRPFTPNCHLHNCLRPFISVHAYLSPRFYPYMTPPPLHPTCISKRSTLPLFNFTFNLVNWIVLWPLPIVTGCPVLVSVWMLCIGGRSPDVCSCHSSGSNYPARRTYYYLGLSPPLPTSDLSNAQQRFYHCLAQDWHTQSIHLAAVKRGHQQSTKALPRTISLPHFLDSAIQALQNSLITSSSSHFRVCFLWFLWLFSNVFFFFFSFPLFLSLSYVCSALLWAPAPELLT